MKTPILETRLDPENPRAPATWRLRQCEDCGTQFWTVEIDVDPRDAKVRVARLKAERSSGIRRRRPSPPGRA
jgi:hypothetical protein